MHSNNKELTIVPFSDEWMEKYLDLLESNDSVDPLYTKKVSRDELRNRTLLKMMVSSDYPGAHILAIQKERVVGSARAFVIPSCGGDTQDTATLSLIVSPEHRGKGVGTRLLDNLSKELKSQGIRHIEIGILDSWEDWQRFLRKRGFAPYLRMADAVLHPDVQIEDTPEIVHVRIRPIRLPEERESVITLYNRERGQDLPGACAVKSGQPAWWEVGLSSDNFDPAGFLVAEDDSGKLVGYVSSCILGDKSQGLIDYLDVVKEFLGKGLRKKLLVQAVTWLRGRGAASIIYRIHIGYRDEEKVFWSVGFEPKDTAAVWRKGVD